MKSYFPVLAWLVWIVLLGPEYRENQWECFLVMFAAIELVPRSLKLLGIQLNEWYLFPVAAFCVAYFFVGHGYLSIPYLLYALWLTLREATELVFLKKRLLTDWLRVFALGYWATGAAFAVLYLLDIRPFDFDPVIVSLTAAHFHVAGFVLTVLIYRMLKEASSPIRSILGLGAMAGMPLVAAGITLTKLGYPAILEQFAALGFVVFALLFLGQQIQLGLDLKYANISRWCWLAGAASLLLGMVLAALYALRFQIPIQWVSIPNMKYWHGTLNALGFAWLSLLAWSQVSVQTQTDSK